MLNSYYETLKVPENEFFKSSGIDNKDFLIPAGEQGNPVPMKDVSPFLRVLLTTDGTITKCLEAFFWEKIKVELIHQCDQTLPFDVPCLHAVNQEIVVTRKVKIIGVSSLRVYATAFSILRPASIPTEIFQRIMSAEKGIGALIRDSDLESYRELLSVASVVKNPIDFELSGEPINCLSRTYGIHLLGKPAMIVTENFNQDLFSH